MYTVLSKCFLLFCIKCLGELLVLMEAVIINICVDVECWCWCYKWKLKTCFSVDYVPHPLEKHYVHQSEQYRPPEGEMEMMTNYTTEYTSMYSAIIFSLTF